MKSNCDVCPLLKFNFCMYHQINYGIEYKVLGERRKFWVYIIKSVPIIDIISFCMLIKHLAYRSQITQKVCETVT